MAASFYFELQTMNSNIIVTGTLAFDYIMDFPGNFSDRIMPDKIHQISLSFLVDKLSKQFGGTAGNIAYTLKLLGAQPLIISCAGNDFAPYESFLTKLGITTEYISQYKDVVTGSYFVVTDKNDNQIGAFYTGATKYAANLSIKNVVKKNNVVVIAPTDPKAMMKYVKECQKQKLDYLFDPAFQIDTFLKEDLHKAISKSKILIGNDYEIALIEKKLSLSHKELIRKVPILVTTLGSRGSLIETTNESINVDPAKPKNISDPTGAGDAYRAGFLAGYIRGFDHKICGQMGSVAAVYTVEKYGTQTHKFTLKEFKKRFFDNFNEHLRFD